MPVRKTILQGQNVVDPGEWSALAGGMQFQARFIHDQAIARPVASPQADAAMPLALGDADPLVTEVLPRVTLS